MPDSYLTIEDGHVSLGGSLLPGIFRRMYISGAVRFDQAEQDPKSGTEKTAMGWEDAEVNLVLDLLTDEVSDCYEKLEELTAIFIAVDANAKPQVYDVTNRHVTARGINQVVFSGFYSSERDRNDTIQATLVFTEHNPPVTVAEDRSTAATGSTPKAEASAPTEPDSVIKIDLAPGETLS